MTEPPDYSPNIRALTIVLDGLRQIMTGPDLEDLHAGFAAGRLRGRELLSRGADLSPLEHLPMGANPQHPHEVLLLTFDHHSLRDLIRKVVWVSGHRWHTLTGQAAKRTTRAYAIGLIWGLIWSDYQNTDQQNYELALSLHARMLLDSVDE